MKKVFLEILENSQENTCARVSFVIKLKAEACNFIKKRIWHSCFPVNFEKLLRTPFLAEHLWWLLQNNSRKISLHDTGKDYLAVFPVKFLVKDQKRSLRFFMYHSWTSNTFKLTSPGMCEIDSKVYQLFRDFLKAHH